MDFESIEGLTDEEILLLYEDGIVDDDFHLASWHYGSTMNVYGARYGVSRDYSYWSS